MKGIGQAEPWTDRAALARIAGRSSTMKPPPMEKYVAAEERAAADIEGSEADAVGVLRVRAGRNHLVGDERWMCCDFDEGERRGGQARQRARSDG